MQVLQHNLTSMFTQREYKTITGQKAKSVEKLSSGYRINRSADDAAGLAISEKLRWQVRGLDRASDNIMDGVSFVQTADGYLNEVHSILQRMNELSIQAANDTNTETDRAQIDEEIQQLKKETNRIFKTADYNTKKIWEVPYTPEVELITTGTTEAIQTSTSLPPGVTMDTASADAGRMANTYSKGGTTYNAATYLDFSGIDMNNLSALKGTGFYCTCCTCDAYYSISLNPSSDTSSESGTHHFTYSVGIAGCTSPSDIVNRIVSATGGNPNGHYTNLDANGSTLVVYDNRPSMTASGDYGQIGAGVMTEKSFVPGGDILQVFNSGTDGNGNPVYGGIEINDVRHTWDELGIEISSDGKSFVKDQEVEFNDYTGERVAIKVKEGDSLPYLARNNTWAADENGIYVNNIFAVDWDTLGIKDGENFGEFQFQHKSQLITFAVEDGDTKEDVIYAINGGVFDKDVSWDLLVGTEAETTAVTITDGSNVRVTESNKNKIDATYSINADTSGITITDNAGGTHSKISWADFVNAGGTRAGDFPIVDWGLSDADGEGLASDLITFDDEAVYVYKDTADSSLPISFAFVMEDEASRDAVISGLNGAVFSNSISAPGTVSATTAGSGLSVSIVSGNMDFKMQRALGRNFDDANASINGTVSRTLVVGDNTASTTDIVDGAVTDGAKTTSTSDVYVSDGNGNYYKAAKTVSTWDRVSERTVTQSDSNSANYKYSGSFGGNDMTAVTGRSFTLSTVTTQNQSRTDSVSQNSYEIDMSQTYTADEITALGGTIDERDTAEHVTEGSYTTNSTSVDRRGSSFTDTVAVATSKGTPMVLEFSNKAGDVSDTDTSINFQASGYASRNFTASASENNNVNGKAFITDVELNVPERILHIQSGALGYQDIPIKWEPLNNSIIGISSVSARTADAAQYSIARVQKAIDKISSQRAQWGAYQNRLEYAYNVDRNTEENTQAGESRIRDTDMAREMVKFSASSIIAQAAEAMLAQANQQPQGILSLLQ